MPVALFGALGTALVNIASSLLTEAFLKRLIVRALEAAAKKSESDTDDKIVKDIKEAWGVD